MNVDYRLSSTLQHAKWLRKDTIALRHVRLKFVQNVAPLRILDSSRGQLEFKWGENGCNVVFVEMHPEE
jgi:hypothetical protein